ncbi:hypothetical protein [Pedobacter sp.]|uniref:hypothetical protein n=1 Tax=Pedobacter sp. TaxID=1411316 RepID=UPI003D7FB896
MVLAGNRALILKNKLKTRADWVDKSIYGTMLLTSIIMLVIGAIGLVQHNTNSILFVFFAGIGVFMTLKAFHTFRTFTEKKNAWLISHLGRMIAALIASFTAFLVAGLHLSTLTIWMLPTIIGTGYKIYWNKKFKNNMHTNLLNSAQ